MDLTPEERLKYARRIGSIESYTPTVPKVRFGRDRLDPMFRAGDANDEPSWFCFLLGLPAASSPPSILPARDSFAATVAWVLRAKRSDGALHLSMAMNRHCDMAIPPQPNRCCSQVPTATSLPTAACHRRRRSSRGEPTW